MFGLGLIAVASLFEEFSNAIGKKKITEWADNLYIVGFFSNFWGMLVLLVIGISKGNEFIFSLSSLPTFLPRIILEIILAHVSLKALAKADRSLHSFIRIITLPLLLVIDIVLGYSISPHQIFGICLIVVALIVLFSRKGISKNGAGLNILSAVLATATITLYKYDISHFNSVTAEQGLVALFMAAYFFLIILWRGEKNPFYSLRDKAFLGQSIAITLAGVIGSFAYLFGAASIITAGKRAIAVLYSIISGRLYFHEKSLLARVVVLVLIILGIILIVTK